MRCLRLSIYTVHSQTTTVTEWQRHKQVKALYKADIYKNYHHCYLCVCQMLWKRTYVRILFEMKDAKFA